MIYGLFKRPWGAANSCASRPCRSCCENTSVRRHAWRTARRRERGGEADSWRRRRLLPPPRSFHPESRRHALSPLTPRAPGISLIAKRHNHALIGAKNRPLLSRQDSTATRHERMSECQLSGGLSDGSSTPLYLRRSALLGNNGFDSEPGLDLVPLHHHCMWRACVSCTHRFNR